MDDQWYVDGSEHPPLPPPWGAAGAELVAALVPPAGEEDVAADVRVELVALGGRLGELLPLVALGWPAGVGVEVEAPGPEEPLPLVGAVPGTVADDAALVAPGDDWVTAIAVPAATTVTATAAHPARTLWRRAKDMSVLSFSCRV